MKKAILTFGIFITTIAFSVAQHVDVPPGLGNGLRLWSSNHYKIHLGWDPAIYNYGPVTNWAIKTNMFNAAGRGWVWGVYNQKPVAAINTSGDMQIAGTFITEGSAAIGTDKMTGFMLSVGGKMRAEEIEVSLSNTWADYVFSDDYSLMPLNELEDYITENNHLPNIPSADEVECNGLSLGEMQAKQMEKIEELTLYIIELEKRIKELEK